MLRVLFKRAILVCLLLAAALTTPARAFASEGDAVVDTLLTGCELYLFGRLVEPVTIDGKTGHRVSRAGLKIFINDILFEDLGAPPRVAIDSLISPRTKAEVAMRQEALKAVRERSVVSGDKKTITVEGVAHPMGTEFIYRTDEDGKPVRVWCFEDRVVINYGVTTIYANEDPHREPPPTAEARAAFTYRHVVRQLRDGTLVSMGRGYATVYGDRSVHAEFRSAVKDIPKLATFLYINIYGDPTYQGLDIGSLSFSPSEVRDYVRAAGQ